MKMKLFGLNIVFGVLFVKQCTSYFYPPLYWHQDNCGFHKAQEIKNPNVTKEYFIKVIPYTGMNVICPKAIIINNWFKDGDPQDHSLFENLWLVDKEGYDNCRVNEKGDPRFNKLVLLCNNPNIDRYKLFAFHPSYNRVREPKFAPGQHYYFISTSRGYSSELANRSISGRRTNCERYHMKLHIYVCDTKKEDCIWEMPVCGPRPELYRDMRLIDGKLPAPTVVRPSTIKTRATSKPTRKPTSRPTRKKETRKRFALGTSKKPSIQSSMAPTDDGHRMPICKKKEKGTSINVILNFVLGGVALFMAVVIIILVYGLSNKAGKYKVKRPASAISSTHGPSELVPAEIVRYSDGHAQIYPVLVHRTPPTSPNVMVVPYPPTTTSSSPPGTPPAATQNPDEESAFVFPVQRRHSAS